MKNRQLAYLFICNFVIWFIGVGLLPLLPLYASSFGATPTMVGVYLAFVYVSITAGTMLTGWLAERLTHKKLFIGAGVLGVPALVLLGQAAALWQVTILTAIIWFSGGIGLTLVGVFTALHADNSHRGKSFSLTWLAYPIAGVTGGMTVGQLIEWQGYATMFAVLGVVWTGWPVVGLLGLEYKTTARPAPSAAMADGSPLRLGSTFYRLLLVVLLSTTTIFVVRLGTSLSMQVLNFSAGAVASTTIVGGLVMIPVTLLIGTLSDHLGRKGFLMLGYALVTVGALALSGATQLWHFWLATVSLFAAMCVNGSVASAYATDLLAPEALGLGLSRLKAMSYVGGIVGFASAGYVIDSLGATNLYLIAAALSLMSVTLLALPSRQWRVDLRIRPRWRRPNLIAINHKA